MFLFVNSALSIHSLIIAVSGQMFGSRNLSTSLRFKITLKAVVVASEDCLGKFGKLLVFLNRGKHCRATILFSFKCSIISFFRHGCNLPTLKQRFSTILEFAFNFELTELPVPLITIFLELIR